MPSPSSRSDPPAVMAAFKKDPTPKKKNRDHNNNDNHETTNRDGSSKAIVRALFWFGLGFLLSQQISLGNSNVSYPTTLEYYTSAFTYPTSQSTTTTTEVASTSPPVPDKDPEGTDTAVIDTTPVDLADSLNLDDPEYLTGYASQRIPFKKLNFCDIGQAGIGRRSKGHKPTTCVVNGTLDPSCEKCLKPNNLKDYQKILDTYENNTTSRRQMFEENLNSDGIIVIIVVNRKYLHFAKNWWCVAAENGLKRENLIMYAIDKWAEEWAKSEGILAVRPELYSFKINGFGSQTKYVLFPLLLDLLHMGRHVVFNDVDLLWTSNLTHNLQNLWRQIPLVTQNSPRWDAQGPLNSGLLSLRPTPQMINFVDTMMETIPIFLSGIQGRTDQLMWNRLLSHHKFRTLPWRTLPDQLVLNAGWDKELKKLTNLTWCIHWVGVHDGTESYHKISKTCTPAEAEVE